MLIRCKIRFHLIWATRDVIRARRTLLSRSGCEVANTHFVYHVQKYRFVIIFPALQAAFHFHLVAGFREICVKAHFWNEYREGVLHFIEAEEFPDKFGAKQAILFTDQFSRLRQ